MNRKDKRQTGLRSPQQSSQRRLDLRIIYRPIDELKPDPANPRRHSKKQIRQIRDSIEAFGFVVPILIDRDGNVIAGHARLLAAKALGWSEVPTLRLDHLTPAQVRAFRIADNRLTEIAVWDDRLSQNNSGNSRCSISTLAQLRRFEHFEGSKYLRLLDPILKGRHYSGLGGAGAAVILGGGWAGSSSLSFCSNRLSSGSGSV
jgi:hypothetical protein